MLEQNRGKEEAKTTWENNEDTLYQVPFPNSPDKKKMYSESRDLRWIRFTANGTRLRRIVSKGNEWKPFYFALRFGIKAKTK